MATNKTLRINKVLRELNISLDRAVEHLKDNGIEIEARPTTKISEKEYEILKLGFENKSKKEETDYRVIDYNSIKDSYEMSIKNLIKTVDKIDFSSLVDSIPKISKSQTNSLKPIYDAYQKEKLVLVLGAGVSLDFGLPSWNSLLQNLMVYTIEKGHETSNTLSKVFNEIFTPNPLISGRYLQNYFETNKSSFEKMVREVLYRDINKDKDSLLLKEIVKLCVAPGKSPNLDSIITYNFDDILEYKLEKTELEIPFKSVHGLGMEIKNEELPIYHVHGYLPQEGTLGTMNKITFGENNYHDQYTDIYSWNNIVQINKFRDNTCLFIGSSLTDPNIRRLLDIAYKQRGNNKKFHYVIKKKINEGYILNNLNAYDLPEDIVEDNLKLEEVINNLIQLYERFEEHDSESFGVKTIWIKDWDEIPQILIKIRESVT